MPFPRINACKSLMNECRLRFLRGIFGAFDRSVSKRTHATDAGNLAWQCLCTAHGIAQRQWSRIDVSVIRRDTTVLNAQSCARETQVVFAHGKDRSQGWSRARARARELARLRLNVERWKLSEASYWLFIFKGQQLVADNIRDVSSAYVGNSAPLRYVTISRWEVRNYFSYRFVPESGDWFDNSDVIRGNNSENANDETWAWR